ncbi:MAG: ATP-dependent DNA helicase RecG [Acidobacteriota bacterium]
MKLVDLHGIGPARERELNEAGLFAPSDLLTLCPIRWEDRRCAPDIATLRSRPAGARATLLVEVTEARLVRTRRRGFSMVQAQVTDGRTHLPVVWFNQPYLARHLVPGRRLWLYGGLKNTPRGECLSSPELEMVRETDPANPAVHSGRVVPVYRRVGRLSGRRLRRILHDLLASPPPLPADPLPGDLRAGHGWPARLEALRAFHFPDGSDGMDRLARFETPGQQRLIFEELYLLAVGLAIRRERLVAAGTPRRARVGDLDALMALLPFALTSDQRRAVARIAADLERPAPMVRLLQGDVGCGKTVVAFLAMLLSVQGGRQAALMAPTEVLAWQHHRAFSRLLRGTGPAVSLLTAGRPVATRRQVRDGLRTGAVRLVIGTHALLQENTSFRDLGLAVIDEQHRFGVEQRLRLGAKGGAVNVLVMSATPIPRSLSLALYGDLDHSEIREAVPGRRPVTTVVRPATAVNAIWKLVRRAVRRGRQVFIVVPRVEQRDRDGLAAAESLHRHLHRGPLAGIDIARLHGRVAANERQGIMEQFAAGSIPVVIATTIVEVGVDVANASVLVVLDADRFGLAQLHQLRGRVGRGRRRSLCLLVHREEIGETAARRLETIGACQDGFELARQDLTLRGTGELMGTRQHGNSGLRIADLIRDEATVQEAHEEAFRRRAHLDAVSRAAAMQRWGRPLGLLPPPGEEGG